jgi:hypothetical protein
MKIVNYKIELHYFDISQNGEPEKEQLEGRTERATSLLIFPNKTFLKSGKRTTFDFSIDRTNLKVSKVVFDVGIIRIDKLPYFVPFDVLTGLHTTTAKNYCDYAKKLVRKRFFEPVYPSNWSPEKIQQNFELFLDPISRDF